MKIMIGLFMALGLMSFTCNFSNQPSNQVAAAVDASAMLRSTSFKVAGNCKMCKKRIEKAALEAGAAVATWSSDSQILAIKFDPEKTTSEKVERAVATVGHDTERFRADDKTYADLHECCQYPRSEK